MSVWNVLGIDPTEDIRVIKKAYAKKLKIHHPEEDPEGYQSLREAYDRALEYAKQEKATTFKTSFENAADNPSVFGSDAVFSDESRNENSKMEVFISGLEQLYNDFPSRIDLKKWEIALNDDVVWNAGYQDILRAKMMDFLMEHPYLPKNVWLLLESTFNWRTQEDYFFAHYPESFVHYVFKQLNNQLDLSFRYLQEAEGIDHEAFLYNRENAFYALADSNLELAGSFITAALSIYSADPDLLRLQGEYYFRLGDWQQALTSYNHCLEIAPYDVECLLNRARTLREMNELQSAIKACDHIRTIHPENLEVMYLQGKCYFETGNTEKAKKIFLETLEKNPFDIEATIYLAKINGELLERLKSSPFKKNRQKLNQIKKELGMPGFLQTVISFFIIVSKRTWPSVVIIGIFLAFWLPGLIKEHDFSIKEYAKQALTDTEVSSEPVTISSWKDLYKSSSKTDRIKLKLSKVYYLSSLDDNELQISEKPDLQKRYFVFAQMDQSFVIINVDYDQAQHVYERNYLIIEGQVYDMDSKLLNFIKSSFEQNLNTADNNLGEFAYSRLIKEKYVGPVSEPEKKANARFIFFLFLGLLLFLTFILFKEAGRAYRAVKY
jgi:tetratricopeptide (TPR) repeat protein